MGLQQITPETSYIAKKKGWKIYRNGYSTPPQAELQQWLRENHEIHIQIDRVFKCYQFDVVKYDEFEDSNELIFNGIGVWDLVRYEDALEEGLMKALESLPNL